MEQSIGDNTFGEDNIIVYSNVLHNIIAGTSFYMRFWQKRI